MANLEKKNAELQELRGALQKFASEKDFSDFTAEDKETWAQMNEDVKALADSVREIQAFENARKENEKELEAGNVVNPLPIHEEKTAQEQPKTLGEEIVDSNAYKSYMENGQLNIT